MRLLFLLFISITFSVNSFAQFTEIKRMELPENHLIGGIATLDVLGESFLITDMQQQVFLYKEGSDKLEKLNPGECFPGFDFQPIHTFHLADSSVFLINAALPGYRFEADGSCRGSVQKDFIQVRPNRLAVNQKERGYFYTLVSYPQQPLKMRKYKETGHLVKEAELIKPSFPVFNYRFEGGGTIAQDGILYYMLPSGKNLNRYDTRREVHLESIAFSLKYRDAMEEDISADPFSPRMVKDITQVTNEHYLVRSMFKLSHRYLLIQTHFRQGDKSRYGIHLFDMESNAFDEKSFILESPFKFARDHRAYRIDDRRMENEKVLNPGILVYEFTAF